MEIFYRDCFLTTYQKVLGGCTVDEKETSEML